MGRASKTRLENSTIANLLGFEFALFFISMSDVVLEEAVRRAGAGEAIALCTIVAARGSTPQAAGARMLVLGDGRLIGTLGGGCVEAEVRQQALRLLAARITRLVTFKLDHDYGWDDGLICGGTMDILVQTLARAQDVEPLRLVLEQVKQGTGAALELPYQTESGEQRTYREALKPPPRLLIVGAGHIGQALAGLAGNLGFDVTVLDDRPDCASRERFPWARRIIGDIEAELARYPIDPQTYVIIVTRGHRHDGRALVMVINSAAKYLGLIGSRRKVLTIFRDLREQGVSIDRLVRVHAPIGLEIGAVTVPEIATSIAAELIAVRRGTEGHSGSAMKFDEARLRELLESDGASEAT
jgi:xanthine dehydrogenase accessory factor